MSSAFRSATAAIAAGAVAFLMAPVASGDDDIYGLITPDERQEIQANGQRICVRLDQAAEASAPLTAPAVRTVVDNYVADGWDLESAGDIVWESVEGRCPEYMPQLKAAMRSYGHLH